MTSVMLSQERWGGTDRTIHTISFPDMKGLRAEVMERRVVKTGKYSPGYYGYESYNGYEDYDPPTLGNEKTHVIYKLDLRGRGNNWYGGYWNYPRKDTDPDYGHRDYKDIEIEKCNLVKISKEEFLRYEEPKEEPVGEDLLTWVLK